MNKRQFFHTCSPNCVISSIQLNSFCCQSEGPVTSFIILQEGTEVVINVWDWCKHTHTGAPIIKCYSQRSYFSYKTATAWVIVVTDVSYGFGVFWVFPVDVFHLNGNNLTFFRVRDLDYRIWSIILGNRLQICPFLPIPETQINQR